MTTLDNQFISSLTGETIDMNQFNSINQFNSSKDSNLFPSIKGDLPINVSSGNRLSELNGENPHLTKRVETEPFFDPKNNMSNVRANNPFVKKEEQGNKNNLYKDREFYENRTNTLQSRFRNKELPFDQVKVGKAQVFNINDYLEYVKTEFGVTTNTPTNEGMQIIEEFFKLAELNKIPPSQRHNYQILSRFRQQEEHFQNINPTTTSSSWTTSLFNDPNIINKVKTEIERRQLNNEPMRYRLDGNGNIPHNDYTYWLSWLNDSNILPNIIKYYSEQISKGMPLTTPSGWLGLPSISTTAPPTGWTIKLLDMPENINKIKLEIERRRVSGETMRYRLNNTNQIPRSDYNYWLEWLKLKERDRVLLAYAGAIKWLVQYESDLYNKSRDAAIQGLKNDLSNKGTHAHNFKPAPFGPPKDISNRTLIGTVCKKKPEGAFKLGKEHFGHAISQTTKKEKRPNMHAKFTNKQIQKSYYGGLKNSVNKNMLKAKIEESTKNTYSPQSPINNAMLTSVSKSSDYGKESMTAPSNERDTTQKESIITNVINMVKSITSPILDKFKKTKKEETEVNTKEGFVSIAGPKKSTIYDPNDIARTTIKETTIDNFHNGHVKGPQKLKEYNAEDIARTTIKETTIKNEREGNIKGIEKLKEYNTEDIAKTTLKETTVKNDREGNMGTSGRFEKHNGYTYEDLPKITIRNTNKHVDCNVNVKPNNQEKMTLFPDQPVRVTTKETTVKHEILGQPTKESNDGYKVANFRAPSTRKQATSNNQYQGNPNSKDRKQTSKTSSENFITNNIKEKVLKGRNPTQNNVKKFLQCDKTIKENLNVSLKRDDQKAIKPSNIEGPKKIYSAELSRKNPRKFNKTSGIVNERLSTSIIPENDLVIKYDNIQYDNTQGTTFDRTSILTNNEECILNEELNFW